MIKKRTIHFIAEQARNVIRIVFKGINTRIYLTVFFVVIAITGYFLVSGYSRLYEAYEENTVTKLERLSTTLTTGIEGDLIKRYAALEIAPDVHYTKEEFLTYYLLYQALKEVNEREDTQIYICTNADAPVRGKTVFGVDSNGKPNFYQLDTEYTQANVFQQQDFQGIQKSLMAKTIVEDKALGATTVVIASKDAKTVSADFNHRYGFYVIGTILLIAIVLALLYKIINGILVKEKEIRAKLIQSKMNVEKDHQAVTDSIRYAGRIQKAILPTPKKIQEKLGDLSIFFQPRDIVSGDFYWFKETSDSYILAVGDCTGHGVPGAFLSLIGNALLDQIVSKNGITVPARILEHLDRNIRNMMAQEIGADTPRDGMDIAICTFDKSMRKMVYAGAHRPLVLVRNGELTEINGSKRPIGGMAIHKRVSFDNHEISLFKGDQVYLFTDGYEDQFGGVKGKKLMKKHMRNLLKMAHGDDMKARVELLSTAFRQWKGEYGQVDDVLLMGIGI